MYPALAGGRIPAGIGPTSVSGSPEPERGQIWRACPTGVMRSDSQMHGEGQALALREGAAFFSPQRGACPRDVERFLKHP